MPYKKKKKFVGNKSIGNAKAPFFEYNPHEGKAPVMNNQNILVASIDPGTTNCGLYVSYYNTETEKHTSLHLERMEFNDGINPYLTSMEKLDKLEDDYKFFSSAHYIIIESQMHNVNLNTRMGQHLITYFLTKFKNKGNKPIVIEISSQAKYRLLEGPIGTEKTERKKWAATKSIELLRARKNDEVELEFICEIESSTKRDDMGDAITQYQAFFKILEGKFARPTMPVRAEQK